MLGILELQLLLAVKKLGNAQGLQLHSFFNKEVAATSTGSIYTTLNRLKNKDLLEITQPKRVGKCVITYSITPSGLRAVDYTLGIIDKLR